MIIKTELEFKYLVLPIKLPMVVSLGYTVFFEKVGIKLNIQKTKIMAFDPITSWQIDGKILEKVADFVFLDFKITADSDCSH